VVDDHVILLDNMLRRPCPSSALRKHFCTARHIARRNTLRKIAYLFIRQRHKKTLRFSLNILFFF
jgi:hypothetical protein